MSTVLPFNAVRYETSRNRDISTRLSPPYDVIDAQRKRELLKRDPKNFVAIDLPHTPPKTAGPPAVYQRAAQTLRDWLHDGALVRDANPGFYVYHQSFRHGDREFTRKMFFARIRLEPFGSGNIFPHEQTFGGPKEDRLALTRATESNMSPIFGLFEDPHSDVANLFEAKLSSESLAHGDLDETRNRLWAVTDPDLLADVTSLMTDRPIYIADGHHRYGTAMMYRDGLAASQGELSEQHPANFVLCALCAMEDPGLRILPTHRVLPGASELTADLLRSDPKLSVNELDAATADHVPAALKRFGPQAVAFCCASHAGYVAVTPAADLMTEIAPDKSDAWRGLGVSFLHSYLIDRVLAPRCVAGQAPNISYVKSAAPAVELASSTGGACFLMQATTMQEMRAVCNAGELMPQKSTYFYPKLASGLVVNPLHA